jgi:hypothetical protein
VTRASIEHPRAALGGRSSSKMIVGVTCAGRVGPRGRRRTSRSVHGSSRARSSPARQTSRSFHRGQPRTAGETLPARVGRCVDDRAFARCRGRRARSEPGRRLTPTGAPHASCAQRHTIAAAPPGAMSATADMPSPYRGAWTRTRDAAWRRHSRTKSATSSASTLRAREVIHST